MAHMPSPLAPTADLEPALPSTAGLITALAALLTAAERYGAAAARAGGEGAADEARLLAERAQDYHRALRALGGDAGLFAVALESRDGQQLQTVLDLQRAR